MTEVQKVDADPVLVEIVAGTLAAYGPIWRDLTQWALLGVVTTELSANAHAYLVTLFNGPKSFALIAAGSLFMRPVSLCLTALPDRDSQDFNVVGLRVQFAN